jgi:hypothetical protein
MSTEDERENSIFRRLAGNPMADMPEEGIEPPTYRLQGGCSTN